jgi:Pyruvate/2-oxoacid:ferredoxin oxidoreductase gamma subunit
MSQRGGAVQAQLRFSDGPIESPQVPRGQADLILAVEPLEALRCAGWLRPDGHVISAMQAFDNIVDYPDLEGLHASLRAMPGAVLVDAAGIAKQAGSPRAMNFAVAGAALHHLPVALETLRAVVLEKAERWSERDRKAALAALEAGYLAGQVQADAAVGS